MRNICLVLIAIFTLLLAGQLNAAEPAAAPATQPSKRANERADKLKADVKTFTLHLTYHGQQEKPYYRLLLSVPNLPQLFRADPFEQMVKIPEAEAKTIIDYLATEGFLDHALDGNRNASPAPPKEPYYTMTAMVQNNGEQVLFEEWLPLNDALITRLKGLRTVLNPEAAKDMDFLIGRLGGMHAAHKK